ncbi:lysylphosphatidylglycerol synthase transmembrane domain-containing protein [Stutzerimonas kirkiae]|uniref:TIGR00374 family protein n=1 Tax=Stutzerimonas kirkiae TaxID=2211392 RepID=A0A4Q9R1J2_9GAMM|nr:lysylphosphatidylglycerol synthase transmembrane domain-containing protein [Stutzerimonas kirkiae]TBU92848.1 TIGR00374 family protein [Stutzerimonas kirkiae]TBV01311.1 TIGR00374 family protein [Stutzerimonas kirkiae]TBV10776.1 TIGR00374 family protein [Stutzerimonas kirkiae]TBV14563.1 TIGR00374 family protein [Stutzerimonas kirkiae]
MNRGGWILLAALIAAALIPLLLGGSESLGHLRRFPLSWLLGMLAMIVLGWSLNALRLRLLLGRKSLGQGRATAIVMATEFAICATPGGAGGPVTLAVLLARQGVAPAKGAATYAVEQLSDLLFFACAMLGVLVYGLTHALTPFMDNLLGGSLALMLVVLTLLGLLARFHLGLFRSAGVLLARLGVGRRRRWRWARMLLRFRNALRASLGLPRLLLLSVFLLTVLHGLLRYSVLYLTLLGLGRQIDWGWSFLVQMLALGAGHLSLLPGGAGSAELASAALLAPMVGKSTSAAAILIWRFVTYHFYLIAGAPVFLQLAGRPLLERLMRRRDRSSGNGNS